MNLKSIEKSATKEHTTKRKIEDTTKETIIKKQKQNHDKELSKDEEVENSITTTETNVEEETNETAENTTLLKESKNVKHVDLAKETEVNNAEKKSAVASEEVDADVDVNVDTHVVKSTKITAVPTTKVDTIVENQNNTKQQGTKDEVSALESFKTAIENTPLTHIQELEEDALSNQDTLSPPSSFIEPMTPPRQMHSTAPYKEYLTEADKQRIEYEKSTLEKLRKSLDIVITDRAARHQPTLYHQIESVLRNSTRRTITLSHICQIVYLTPNLYTLEAKELRNFGGKVTEAFLIQFTKDWSIPLAGKDLQKRADILNAAITQFFVEHPEVKKNSRKEMHVCMKTKYFSFSLMLLFLKKHCLG